MALPFRDWFKSKAAPEDAALEAWRADWRRLTGAPDREALGRLRTSLEQLRRDPEAIEIEMEMLDGVSDLVTLTEANSGGLPVVETGHKVVGAEPCHFEALASRPDDPAQASGRLFFTGTRAIFAGGARALSCAWHTVTDVLQSERDIVLVGRTPDAFYTFRCNSYTDALCGAYVARQLVGRRGR